MFLSVACLPLIAGCSKGTEASIGGNVTLDGSPLNDATITFIPTTGGQRQAAWATINAGKYSISAASGLGLGQFRVEVRALRPMGDKMPSIDPTLPIPAKEAVPSRYNSKSELAVEIKPGANTANFDLKSK